MRLSTRFGLAAVLAALPLLGVLAYCFDQMHELARSNERLAVRQFVGAQLASGVIGRVIRLREFQLKYAISDDLGYAQKYRQTASAVDEVLRDLLDLAETPAEREGLAELLAAWNAIDARHGPSPIPEEGQTLADALAALETQAGDVQARAREAAQSEVAAARAARIQTQRAAMIISAMAIIVSSSLILWGVRSLRQRLDQLTEATSAVSRGAFTYRMNVEGNDELAALAESFNEMINALSQLERIKDDFVSSMSHELKTPLVAMIETNLLLLDEVSGPLNAKQRRMLKLNSSAAQRLSNMLNDLLDLSRAKAGIRYSMSEQDLAILTQKAVNEFEALALERGVEMEVVAPDVVKATCDPDRYVQVVQNLVENALKHTPSGGTVMVGIRVVSVSALPRGVVPIEGRASRYAWLEVADTGPGIAAEDRQRIFEKFFRRQGQPSDAGVGLGLAICKEIVAAHRGGIWVDRGRLPGATFCVALPCEDHLRTSATSRRPMPAGT